METTVAFIPRETVSRTVPALRDLIRNTPSGSQMIAVVAGFPETIKNEVTEMLRSVGGEVIDGPTFLPPNHARNLALEKAKGRYIAFVDNDVTVAENWLSPLVDCARETGAAIVGPMTFEGYPEFRRIHMAGGEISAPPLAGGLHGYCEAHHHAHRLLADISEPIARSETELVEFHTVLVETEWLRSQGGLDPRLLSVSEHWDMCFTAARQGRLIYIEPESRVNYAPPRDLTPEDIRFFNLRWSMEWCTRSLDHLSEKHRIARRELRGVQRFVIEHRFHRFSPLKHRLKKSCGSIIGSLLTIITGACLLLPDSLKLRADLKKWRSTCS
ncbi:MAG: glycosyltransferase [Akkermansiaceae bacterium]|jgi:hypothetical protein|nr:glycosyltransferase [Akkermansiaceae bacterium]